MASTDDKGRSRLYIEPPPNLTREEFEALCQESRLSLPTAIRIPVATTLSFMTGLVLGATQGSKMAGLRFRAEHAHKLPTSTTGWYLYHKSKNYQMMFGGIKEGVKMGLKVSFWTTAMFSLEAMFDEYRGTADIFNTITSCVTVAGGFSLWNRFSLPMTARTTKFALVAGLVYGGLQDALGVARGRPIGYTDWIRTQLGFPRQQLPKKQ